MFNRIRAKFALEVSPLSVNRSTAYSWSILLSLWLHAKSFKPRSTTDAKSMLKIKHREVPGFELIRQSTLQRT